MPKCLMRDSLDTATLMRFMEEIGKAARGPGRIYLVGGAAALLLGIREKTIDIDIKLDPEPQGVFETIAVLKKSLRINVELASPDQFVPALPDWEGRSEFIARKGQVDFYVYDYYGQALAKIQRGHALDVVDVDAYVTLGKVDPHRLRDLFVTVMPDLLRYPAVDRDELASRVDAFVRKHEPR